MYNQWLKSIIIINGFVFISLSVSAQRDSSFKYPERNIIYDTVSKPLEIIEEQPVIVINKPTEKAKKDTVNKHSPQRAAIMSAIVPGLGQIYNRKYWKLPIVYATGAAVAYALVTNTQNYNVYKKAYFNRMDNDPQTIDDFPLYSSEQIKALRDRSLKNLEWSYIFTTIWYVLNIVDANVDAHFFDFDVNDNLSLRLYSSFQYQTMNSKPLHSGFSIQYKF